MTVVEDGPMLSPNKRSSKNVVLAVYDSRRYLAEVNENECINERHLLVNDDNLTTTAR